MKREEPKFENSIENTINFMNIANAMFSKKEEPKQEMKIGDNTNFGIITDIKEYSVCFGKNSKGVDIWYKKSSVKLKYKQDYKKLSKKFTETLINIPDDVLIKYTQQETLEEVAERMFPNRDDLHLKREFRHGANYQAKRSYNKEDMIEASKYGYNFHKTTQFPEQEFEDSCIRNTQQWLTQFKKNIKL